MQKNVKDAIGKATNYTFDFDYVYVFEDIVERIDIDSEDISEEIYNAIDDVFIYYDNQWKVAKHFFNSPFDVTFDSLFEELVDDIYKVIEILRK